MKEERPIDLIGYLWTLRKHAAWGLLVAVLVGAAGLFMTRTTPEPTTTAVAIIIGEPQKVTEQPAAQRQAAFFVPILGTAVRLGTTERVLGPVAEKYHLEVAYLQQRTRLRMPTNSQLVEIIYTGTEPASTKEVLGAIAESLLAEMSRAEDKSIDVPVAFRLAVAPNVNVEPALTSELAAAVSSDSSKSMVIRVALVGGAALTLGVATTLLLATIGRRRLRS